MAATPSTDGVKRAGSPRVLNERLAVLPSSAMTSHPVVLIRDDIHC